MVVMTTDHKLLPEEVFEVQNNQIGPDKVNKEDAILGKTLKKNKLRRVLTEGAKENYKTPESEKD